MKQTSGAVAVAACLAWLAGDCDGGPAGARKGMTLTDARAQMVREQLAGPGRGITNTRVLEVMGRVPRHEFVPASEQDEAYHDHPLPIGHGQTISQPYIVAFMTEALDPKPTDRVLEIGTGSGYQAAVLAELVQQVYSIEIIEPVGKNAAALLQQLGYKNISTRIGDGYHGWPERAPFDSIIVTAAAAQIPPALVAQLKPGGRMVIPVGAEGEVQFLHVMVKRADGSISTQRSLPVRFVPLTRSN